MLVILKSLCDRQTAHRQCNLLAATMLSYLEQSDLHRHERSIIQDRMIPVALLVRLLGSIFPREATVCLDVLRGHRGQAWTRASEGGSTGSEPKL